MEKSLFYSALEAVINNWSALELALQHGMGGLEGLTKKEWLIGAIEQYFLDNNGLDVDEVEDFLENFLNDEFQTIAEDGSVSEIAGRCCQFYSLLQQNKCDEVLKLLSNLPVLEKGALQADSRQALPETASFPVTVSSSNSKMDNIEDMDTESLDTVDEGWQTVSRTRRNNN